MYSCHCLPLSCPLSVFFLSLFRKRSFWISVTDLCGLDAIPVSELSTAIHWASSFGDPPPDFRGKRCWSISASCQIPEPSLIQSVLSSLSPKLMLVLLPYTAGAVHAFLVEKYFHLMDWSGCMFAGLPFICAQRMYVCTYVHVCVHLSLTNLVTTITYKKPSCR